MTESAYPKSGGPLSEEQWSQILSRVYHGVDGASSLAVTADGGGLRVFVAEGRAGVEGHGYENTAALEVPIDAGDTLARVDVICLALDYSADPIVQVSVVKGSPGAGAPSLDPSGTVVARLPLANIAVAASAVTIPPGAVSDRRVTVDQTIAAAVTAIDASTITTGTLAEGRIPGLPASKITSGTLPVARGGTGGATKPAGRSGLGITSGTANPTGGDDGDIYFKVV